MKLIIFLYKSNHHCFCQCCDHFSWIWNFSTLNDYFCFPGSVYSTFRFNHSFSAFESTFLIILSSTFFSLISLQYPSSGLYYFSLMVMWRELVVNSLGTRSWRAINALNIRWKNIKESYWEIWGMTKKWQY